MKRFLGALLVSMALSCSYGSVLADDKKVTDVIDKAIKAMGGEERLVKAEVATSKTRVKFVLGGREGTLQLTEEGADRSRSELEREMNGQTIKTLIIYNGVKGWLKTGETVKEWDQAEVLLAKGYRESFAAVTRPVILKSPRFLVQMAGETKIEDKSIVVLDVVGTQGQEFKIFLDKESSLPVKLEAKVSFPDGRKSAMETTFANYKDFDGIKVATKRELRRDGRPAQLTEIIEFNILEKAPPGSFDEPK
jgi:hypothetical protein